MRKLNLSKLNQNQTISKCRDALVLPLMRSDALVHLPQSQHRRQI